jgi:hypothetical protein
VGRPRQRWPEYAENDLQELKVKRLRELYVLNEVKVSRFLEGHREKVLVGRPLFSLDR